MILDDDIRNAMRTIIDITDEQVKALDEISKLEETSRAALIRQAIDRMLAEEARGQEAAQAAFGLWSGRKKDGLEIEAMARHGKLVTQTPDPKPAIVPPAPPVVEDLFVTTPPVEAVVESAEPVAPIAAAPPPPVREASMVSTDPLAAFFAGVKP